MGLSGGKRAEASHKSIFSNEVLRIEISVPALGNYSSYRLSHESSVNLELHIQVLPMLETERYSGLPALTQR
jgi:hypothetical protein